MYVIRFDEYNLIGTRWITSNVNKNSVTYFDSFKVEHIVKEIKTFICKKNIITNTFRIQAYDSIMCGYFCIWFVDFMFKGKTLTAFANLFSSNDLEKNFGLLFEI